MRRTYISAELAAQIKRDIACRQPGESHASIGRRYGIPRETVSRISRGEWQPRRLVAQPKSDREWREMSQADRAVVIANRAGSKSAIAARLTEHLIEHAKTCDTNARIRAIMESAR